jgi:hypothetical protein
VSQITKSPPASPGRPAPQYLSAERVVAEMADHGTRRLQRLSVAQILVLAMLAGGFVTVGALFSVLLATGVSSPGAQRLVEGLGFSAGFFFVILSDAVLFTEANVVLPATLLRCHVSPAARLATIARFWALAWAGNLAGAFLVGYAIHLGLHYPPDVGGLHRGDRNERGARGYRVGDALQGDLAHLDPAAGLREEREEDAGEVAGRGKHLAAGGQVGRNQPGEHRHLASDRHRERGHAHQAGVGAPGLGQRPVIANSIGGARPPSGQRLL